MARPPNEDCIDDCYKAKYTMQYLEDYAERMSHNGVTLKERIIFGMNVESVEKIEGLWRVICFDSEKNKTTFMTQKMIIASGQHSEPNIPQINGQEEFNAPIVHSAAFGTSNILSVPNANRFTIVGAGKSAADMLYETIKAGKQVTWIISESGTGPGFFAPLNPPTSYNNGNEAAQTRAMSLLQPSMLHEDGWWIWLFHQNWIGIAIVGWLFNQIDKTINRGRITTADQRRPDLRSWSIAQGE
jgi:dimethylaniline monooxygenase (N-oxide forming)